MNPANPQVESSNPGTSTRWLRKMNPAHNSSTPVLQGGVGSGQSGLGAVNGATILSSELAVTKTVNSSLQGSQGVPAVRPALRAMSAPEGEPSQNGDEEAWGKWLPVPPRVKALMPKPDPPAVAKPGPNLSVEAKTNSPSTGSVGMLAGQLRRRLGAAKTPPPLAPGPAKSSAEAAPSGTPAKATTAVVAAKAPAEVVVVDEDPSTTGPTTMLR